MLSADAAGKSIPVLMGDSWPVWEMLMVDETGRAAAEVAKPASIHGGEVVAHIIELPSSESMLWVSDHDGSPSSDTTGREESIARQ